jgi:hypothetical protein
MKLISAAFGFSILISAGPFAWGEDLPTIKSIPPQNGVFVTYTGCMNIVIELKDGKFRYWFESDEKKPDESVYPLTGNYTVSDNRIVLAHPKIHPYRYTFRSVDGKSTLWREDAIKMDEEGRFSLGPSSKYTFDSCGTGSILVLSPRKAEKAWAHKLMPAVPEGALRNDK